MSLRLLFFMVCSSRFRYSDFFCKMLILHIIVKMIVCSENFQSNFSKQAIIIVDENQAINNNAIYEAELK